MRMINTSDTALDYNSVSGKVHSFQSLGTVDGPGVRFVVFMQGCPLKCGCCHNPDTWDFSKGEIYTAQMIIEKAVRFKEYFGKDGGITISGGEPLLQPKFCNAIFKLAHQNGINTCLDTSGYQLNDRIEELLKETDRVLLDIKYTNQLFYLKHVGCSIDKPLKFLEYLNAKNIPTTIRQVIIPTLNDTAENVLLLNDLISKNKCVDKIELLPFRKICQVKYDDMGIQFPFKDIPEANDQTIKRLEKLISL